jgi:hypothetical protein
MAKKHQKGNTLNREPRTTDDDVDACCFSAYIEVALLLVQKLLVATLQRCVGALLLEKQKQKVEDCLL